MDQTTSKPKEETPIPRIRKVRKRFHPKRELPKSAEPYKRPLQDDYLVSLIKLYPWIKEEMENSLIKATTKHFLDKNKLTVEEHTKIDECRTRRRRIDLLFGKVLKNTELLRELDICLREQGKNSKRSQMFSTKLEITSENILDSEWKDFREINGGKIETFESISEVLEEQIKEKLKIHVGEDTALLTKKIDCLFSRFFISIDEHAVISDSPTCEKLLVLLRRRPERVYKNVLAVIEKSQTGNNHSGAANEHFIRNTQRSSMKRRSNDDIGADCTPRKKTVLDSKTEDTLIKRVKSMKEVRQKVEEQTAFSVEDVEKGSIIITLKPTDEKSWDKLKLQCKNGSIKDLIPTIFDSDESGANLPEGEYRIEFQIWSRAKLVGEQPFAEFHFKSAEDKHYEGEQPFAEFHFKSAEDKHYEGTRLLLESYEDLVEELEVTDELNNTLTEHNIVDDSFDDKVQRINEREKRNRFLLQAVEKSGDKGYQILKDHVKKTDTILFEKMENNEKVASVEKYVDNTSIAKRTRSQTGILFYSATVIFDVKTEAEETDGEAAKRKKTRNVTVKVINLLDPKCHFNSGDLKEETTQLETAGDLFDFTSRVSEGTMFHRRGSKRIKKGTASVQRDVTKKK